MRNPARRKQRTPSLTSLGLRVGIVAALALTLAIGALSWVALGAVEERLEPVMKDKARVLARSIAGDLDAAIRLDIPIDSLRAVDAYLDSTLADHPEIASIAIADAAGQTMFSAPAEGRADRAPDAAEGDLQFVHALTHDGEPIGSVIIGMDPRYITDTMRGALADIGISLFVAVLVVLELTLLVLSFTVVRSVGLMQGLMQAVGRGDFSASAASRGRDDLNRVLDAMNRVNADINRRFQALTAKGGAMVAELRRGRLFADGEGPRPIELLRSSDVRFSLFFFIFGVELSRPFFPLFVRELYDPALGIDESIAIALPMSVWVVAMLATTPFAPRLIRRWGVRELLLAGMAPTSIGLIATSHAGGFVELIAWRCLTAAGFGLVTATILIRLATTAPARRTAFNIGVFVAATGGGSICGTALGGILAERLGYANTFIVGAAVVFVAMAITFAFLSPGEGVGQSDPSRSAHNRRANALGVYGSVRFLTFMALSALPSRIVLTGFLFFLVPLYLDSIGFGGAAIGRTMMVYFIVLLAMNQVAAFLADRFDNHEYLIVAGGFSAALGCLLFVTATGVWPLVGGIALVGLGQSFVMTPQIAVLPDLFRGEAEAFGRAGLTAAFRVIERFGSVAGPLVAGAILAAAGIEQAGRVIGYGIAATTLLLALLLALGFIGRRVSRQARL